MIFSEFQWWDWIGFISSILTIISFSLFLRERHLRKINQSLILGFLYGLKALSKGMSSAGDEWRYDLEKKKDGYTEGYANTSTNNWITLREQVNHLIQKMDGKPVLTKEQNKNG